MSASLPRYSTNLDRWMESNDNKAADCLGKFHSNSKQRCKLLRWKQSSMFGWIDVTLVFTRNPRCLQSSFAEVSAKAAERKLFFLGIWKVYPSVGETTLGELRSHVCITASLWLTCRHNPRVVIEIHYEVLRKQFYLNRRNGMPFQPDCESYF